MWATIAPRQRAKSKSVSAIALLAAARLVPITQSGAVGFSGSAPDVLPRTINRRAPASWQHNVNAVGSRRIGIRSA